MPDINQNPSCRILVVDNDIKLRSMLSMILIGHGYEVCQADDGQEAVALHRRQPFDLIITELAVGGKDGFQTILELRREPIPVKVIATARMNWLPADFSLRMAEHLGAHSVLAKPYDPEQLLAAVRSALGED